MHISSSLPGDGVSAWRLSQYNYIITISILGGFGGLVRTDFYQFFTLGGCEFGQFSLQEGGLALKGLIFDNFFERVWWS